MKDMALATARARRADPVVQFSIFTPNRLGRWHDLIGLLSVNNEHVLHRHQFNTLKQADISR